jgi:hypothetical protein
MAGKLFIENINPKTTQVDIEILFSKYGKVESGRFFFLSTFL